MVLQNSLVEKAFCTHTKIIVSFPWSLTTLLQVVGEIQRYDDIFNLACHYERALETVIANPVFIGKVSKKGFARGFFKAIENKIADYILDSDFTFERIDIDTLFAGSRLMTLSKYPEYVQKIKSANGFSKVLNDYLKSSNKED